GTDVDVVSKDIEEETDRKLLHIALNHLNEREKQIVEMRFGIGGQEEMTQKEVADSLGISQSYISRLEKKIMKRLHKEFLKLC
ncbi:MAG: sigma-70 family RNA polymerase sigma factor, partial [Defluviitaleaceae bacterium]|nr:sigma-70 family RNA polymerase sigma factor [Defluviitaleaceae bacterium]